MTNSNNMIKISTILFVRTFSRITFRIFRVLFNSSSVCDNLRFARKRRSLCSPNSEITSVPICSLSAATACDLATDCAERSNAAFPSSKIRRCSPSQSTPKFIFFILFNRRVMKNEGQVLFLQISHICPCYIRNVQTVSIVNT